MLRVLVTALMLATLASPDHPAHAGEDQIATCKDTEAKAAGLKDSSFSKPLDKNAECLGGPITDRSGDGRKVVIWFGDSNTVPDSLPEGPRPSWCQQIVDLVPADWEIVCARPFAMGLATVVPTDDWVDALDQVQGALANIEFDAAVLAYGTGDLLRRVTPREIVNAYRNVTGILCNAGKSVYIATTPYVWPPEHPGNLRVDALNAALAEALPYKALIDVTTGFDIDDYLSDSLFVHFSERGQELRAQRAAVRLLANSVP